MNVEFVVFFSAMRTMMRLDGAEAKRPVLTQLLKKVPSQHLFRGKRIEYLH